MDLLPDNRLEFAFPEIHPDAVLQIEFQRTLRVPDDGQHHHLPPGLGRFPLRGVDELDPERVPTHWLRRGGMVMPMWQAEACWLRFSSPAGYPFLLKVGAGKINAVTGAAWRNEPDFGNQDYVEVPSQPWLDGFKTDDGTVRQFVAMPLGCGYTVEEQITGEAWWGGVQLLAHPLKGQVWQRRMAEEQRRQAERERRMAEIQRQMAEWLRREEADFFSFCRLHLSETITRECRRPSGRGALAMGLAPGGSIRQEIERARERRSNWELSARARCFVHLANSEVWRGITGEAPPTVPPSAADYTRAGLPWFDWYAEQPMADPPSRPSVLRRVRSVCQLSRAKGETVLPENESFPPPRPVRLRRPNRAARLDGRR